MTAGNDTRPEAPEIWLEPSCCALGPQNVSLKPGACKEHGNASTLYVRADALRPAASEGEGVTLTFVSGRLPEVLPGNMKLVIAAGISPEGTKTCFPAYYLNAYPLEYTDSCEERGCTHPETEDGCPTTGWFYEESNFEYETCYHPVRGEVIAWAVWPDRESVHAAISAALKPPQSTPEKIAPVQGYLAGIPWAMHLRAYDVYCKEHRPQKALIEGGCRKGFHVGELDEFIPGWREELSELHQLRAAVAKQSSSLALAEENRVLRVHLDQLIEATTNLLIHVDTSTCGSALLTFYHEAKSAKDRALAALSTPSPNPHSQREEAFGEMRTLLHDLEAHCAVKTTPPGDLAAHNTEGVALRERMKSVLALAESCK